MLTVVLDDDPTGTQSATDVEVLLRWDVDRLEDALSQHGSVYLQTNSRALPEADAVRQAETIREQVAEVERRLGRPLLVVLRGDSTLRGHVFPESDVFAGDGGRILFVPAFPAGGRTTVDSIHRVVIDGLATPVGETEFAQDPVFGYRSSHLVAWVREKGDRMAVPVALEELRRSGGFGVAEALLEAGPREVVVPDVETDRDLELVHRGLMYALERGVRVVVRTGATLAAICAGRLSAGYLSRPITNAAGPVVVVCGSHTRAAGAQIAQLVAVTGVEPVVVHTDGAFADPVAEGRRVAAELAARMTGSTPVILASERTRRAADDTLAHGELVMRALMLGAQGAIPRAATIVSKGGITAAEVAGTFFGADRATVRGQIAPGISVWDFDVDGIAGTQVVVPGNVGDADTLIDALDALGVLSKETR